MTDNLIEQLPQLQSMSGVFISKEVVYAILAFAAFFLILKSGALKKFSTPWGTFVLTKNDPDPSTDSDSGSEDSK